MEIYGIIIVAVTICAWLYEHVIQKQKKIVFWCMVFVATLFEGLRGVGTDYLGYRSRFDQIASGLTYSESSDFSLVYTLMRLINKLGGSYQVVIFLISFVTIFIAFYIFTIYESEINITIAVFSYMTMFYQMSFNIFRQILAAEIFLLGITFLYKTIPNKRAYWILSIVAVLIHNTIIPFILIYYFRDFICERKYVIRRIFLYLVSIVMVFSLPNIAHFLSGLATKFPHYAYYFLNFTYIPVGFGVFRYILLVFVPVILLLYCHRKNEIQKAISYSIFFSIMGTIIMLTSYVSLTFIYRVGYTLLVALPILHGYFIKSMRKDWKFFSILILMFTLISFWWYDYAILNSGETVPYKFY